MGTKPTLQDRTFEVCNAPCKKAETRLIFPYRGEGVSSTSRSVYSHPVMQTYEVCVIQVPDSAQLLLNQTPLKSKPDIGGII